MATHDKRPAFRKAFLTYLIIFLGLITAAIGVSLRILKQQQLQRVCQSYQDDAEKVVMMAETQLSQLLDIRADYANARWVNKLSVQTDTFDGEFDTLARMEYSDMLLQTLILAPSLKDIALLIPQKDLAVSQKGWFSFTDYNSYLCSAYGLSAEDWQELYEQSNNFHPAGSFATYPYNLEGHSDLMILQSIDPVYPSRGTLLLIAGREELAAGAMLYSGLDLAAFAIFNNLDEPLLERRTAQLDNSYTVELSSGLLNLTYRLEYPTPESRIPPLLSFNWLLAILVPLLLVLSAAISYLLADIYYRPLRKVLELARNLECPEGENLDGGEYRQLETVMHSLYGETRSLQRDLDFYYRAARNDFLVRLLRGCFGDDIPESMSRYRVPFREDAFYAVLLVEQPLRSTLSAQEHERLEMTLCAERFFKDRGLEPQSAETVNSDLVFIVPFEGGLPEQKLLPILAEELRDVLFQECQFMADVHAGDPYPGILGISKSYQELEERLRRRDSGFLFGLGQSQEGIRYYCPTDWQMQLVKQLKMGNQATAQQILEALRTENQTRALSRSQRIHLLTLLAETVQRAAGEVDFTLDLREFGRIRRDVHRGREDPEALWAPMIRLMEQFCAEVNRSRQHGMICTDNPILQYVNEHFASPEMSLKEVGSRFSMSVSSVSKAFKECSHMNFYDYVTNLRMEKAKELLRDSDMEISQIARAVGYENDYSFRRAFQRYEKAKPSDYARAFRIIREDGLQDS